MQEVAQGEQADNAQVPQGTSSVSVQGSAGTSVSLAAPSLGLSVKGEGLSGSATSSATLTGGLILPRCTTHSLNSYYATDHLGTVRFVKTVDDTGIVTTSTHDYEPFGVEITPADSCDNTHKFTGHERDALPDGTNIDYMHFRFYGASIGRFQKPDSVMGSLANPQSLNLYSYVKGNPVNYNDPTGHLYRLAGGGGAAHSSNPMPCSQPFVDRSVDLEEYLWGGAQITETIRQVWSGGNLLASWVASENQTINIKLNVVLDESLSEKDRALLLEKFRQTQLADAQNVYGRLGIHLTIGNVSAGNVTGSGSVIPGKINVLLSNDFKDLTDKGVPGAAGSDGKTGVIKLSMDKVYTHSLFHENTFTHELGHVFGFSPAPFKIDPKDALLGKGANMLMNFFLDTEINNYLEGVRYSPFPMFYGKHFRDAAQQWGE